MTGSLRRRFSATPYLFLAPALALIGVFVLYPIAAVVYYSLTDYDIVRPPVFIGLDNYAKLIGDDVFWLALTHSFVYLLVTPIIIFFSILLAIAVNRRLRGISVFRALYFVPAVSGSIAIGLSWRWLFERTGFVNSVLQTLGIIHTPIQWLADPTMVLPLAMLLTIWAGFGFYSVIFLAGLQNISEELYDAALIDGCSGWQKHRYVSLPGLRPQIVFVAVISSLAALKVFDEIYVLTNRTGGILEFGHDHGVLPVEAGVHAATRGLRLRAGHRPARDHARVLDRQRPAARARTGGRGMSQAELVGTAVHRVIARPAARRRTKVVESAVWYVILTAIAVITVFPFLWMLLTSIKGPTDAITSVPPQFIPNSPTLDNYAKVWDQLPIARFFLNSITVSIALTGLNVLVAALAAYPLAKMRFRGRDAIFYLLLATLIVPAQLTYIPSFILAVNVFHYYDTLAALVFPSLASAFNIFLLRQAFRGVPNDLIDAARVDGAGELRIWAQILMPIVRPSLAAVAIFTFVTSWNDFLWPSLMLHTRDGMTLPVGLAALQGLFSSDFRSIAAGVTMTVLPILTFFVFVQRYFVRGLAGAVKG